MNLTSNSKNLLGFTSYHMLPHIFYVFQTFPLYKSPPLTYYSFNMPLLLNTWSDNIWNYYFYHLDKQCVRAPEGSLPKERYNFFSALPNCSYNHGNLFNNYFHLLDSKDCFRMSENDHFDETNYRQWWRLGCSPWRNSLSKIRVNTMSRSAFPSFQCLKAVIFFIGKTPLSNFVNFLD